MSNVSKLSRYRATVVKSFQSGAGKSLKISRLCQQLQEEGRDGRYTCISKMPIHGKSVDKERFINRLLRSTTAASNGGGTLFHIDIGHDASIVFCTKIVL